jgi:hypothetical protein
MQKSKVQEVASLLTYRAVGVQVSGSYAYLAEDWAGMKVIDISDPSLPRVVGEWNTPGNAEEITLSDGRAFIADGPSGLRVVDWGVQNDRRMGVCGSCNI